MKNKSTNISLIVGIVFIVLLIVFSVVKLIDTKTTNVITKPSKVKLTQTFPTQTVVPTIVIPDQVKELKPQIDTSDWLTYKNTSVQIQFKYPRKFNVTKKSETSIRDNKSIIFYAHFTDNKTVIDFSVNKNFDNLAIGNILGKGPFLNYNANIIQKGNIKYVKVDKTIGIAGEKVKTYVYRSLRDVIFVHNGFIYEFVLGDDDITENNILLDTILSTLEFK